MRKIVFIGLVVLLASCKKEKLNSYTVSEGSGVYDIDSNFYKTVKIGETEWMAENLRVSRLTNGEKIKFSSSATEFKENEEKPMFTYYKNDSSLNMTYGKLYNLQTVFSGVCPTGWHVPKEDEWLALLEGFGEEKHGGGALKEVGFTYWNAPNTGATNETKLAFRGGGYLNQDGEFEGMGTKAAWWAEKTSFTFEFTPGAFFLENKNSKAYSYYQRGYAALSIRCKKD